MEIIDNVNYDGKESNYKITIEYIIVRGGWYFGISKK